MPRVAHRHGATGAARAAARPAPAVLPRGGRIGGGGYVAVSDLMRDCLAKISQVAPTETTVLIRGETGTGKEGLARLLHEHSLRSAGPFEIVNLGAVPEALVESALFGHEQGAFTGAVRRRVGRFELASGGTLFLDEIGDAPERVQVKLLRVLEERHIERVGGAAKIPVDVRIIAATNRHLERLMAESRFRADLFFRLNAFPVLIPPLRQRPEDIVPLARHLLLRHARRMHRPAPALGAELAAELVSHDWPGNVRELENFLERALILSPPDELRWPGPPGERHAVGGPADELPAEGTFDEMVRAILGRALAATRGRVYGADGAAARLDLKPTTLQSKLKRYGLRREAFVGTGAGAPTSDADSPSDPPEALPHTATDAADVDTGAGAPCSACGRTDSG